MALSGLTVEIDKEPNACLLPLQGEGRYGDGFKVKSKAPPSKSSPLRGRLHSNSTEKFVSTTNPHIAIKNQS